MHLVLITIIQLLFVQINLCDNYFWNNSIIQQPPWPIDKCPVENHTNCSLFESKSKSNCSDSQCELQIALILPEDRKYIVNLNESLKILEEASAKVNEAYGLKLNFTFQSYNDECKQETATVRMIQAVEAKAHVVFGSVCDYCLAAIGRIGKSLGNIGIPSITPAGFTFDFSKQKQNCDDEFYMVVNSGAVDFRSFGEFFHLIMERYNWKKVALMYDKTERTEIGGENTCQFVMSSLLEDIKSRDNLDYHDGDLVISKMTPKEYISKIIGTYYGIIVTCTSSEKLREFAIEAYEMNLMESGEYTVFNIETFSDSEDYLRPWLNSSDTNENNEKARKGFKSIYTFRSGHEIGGDKKGQFYLDSLYDGMLLYGHALKRTFDANPGGKPIEGREVVKNMMGTTFQGKNNETIIMNCNGQRVAEYFLVHMNSADVYETIAIYTTLNKTITFWRDDWIKGDPLDTPVCGFDMSLCPKFDTVMVLIASLVTAIVVGFAIVGFMIFRHYKLKNEIYQMLWKVDYDDILIVQKRRRSSFQSTMSLYKDNNWESLNADGVSMAEDRLLFTNIGYYKKNRVALKYFDDVKIPLQHNHLKELKTMKDLSHDNLVKFFGACLTIPNCILTEYCDKGSLQDILENDSLKLDHDFKFSIIMDVLRGMIYLHSSNVKSHGALKSSNCLVDSRFVVKISDFGLHFLRKYSKENDEEEEKENSHRYWERQLWTAPELLRMDSPPPEGTQKGDVYSFGFIMHEIIERKGVFHLEYFLSAKEKVDAVRRGPESNGGQPFRPSLGEVDEEVTQIMKKCWAEDSADRPDFVTLKSKFRNINNCRQSDTNILDNLLARMEQYANNLEALVEERTSDYLEEKRKCEELLYQLLPKSVAQQLISGQSVIAETYEHVTIHFSDIVGFTALSADSTPLQVVDFLNELYTLFDSIIENYHVYKVETIGDSYMVVSGLPERNGDKHACEIARMSLALLRGVQNFRIHHRPDTILKLRIGMHTGPCVAGVVGLKMPRYCLFGDTVNTASRMETNGEPLRIHISPATKEFLDKFGVFDIERRGEVEVKGKGKMVTYWLNGERNSHVDESNSKKLPSTPIPASVRKQMASSAAASRNERDDVDVPLLSVTSPKEYF